MPFCPCGFDITRKTIPPQRANRHDPGKECSWQVNAHNPTHSAKRLESELENTRRPGAAA